MLNTHESCAAKASLQGLCRSQRRTKEGQAGACQPFFQYQPWFFQVWKMLFSFSRFSMIFHDAGNPAIDGKFWIRALQVWLQYMYCFWTSLLKSGWMKEWLMVLRFQISIEPRVAEWGEMDRMRIWLFIPIGWTDNKFNPDSVCKILAIENKQTFSESRCSQMAWQIPTPSSALVPESIKKRHFQKIQFQIQITSSFDTRTDRP